jgi:hypothetical protein
MQGNRAALERELRRRNDSLFCSSLDYYLAVLEVEGFRRVFEMEIPPVQHASYETKAETLYVFHHSGTGAVLRFDTLHGWVNGGDVYFNCQPNPGFNYSRFKFMSGVNMEDGLEAGSFDCREGIRMKLNCMRANEVLLRRTPIPEPPFRIGQIVRISSLDPSTLRWIFKKFLRARFVMPERVA